MLKLTYVFKLKQFSSVIPQTPLNRQGKGGEEMGMRKGGEEGRIREEERK
jgi:hypothetical protein